MPWSIPIPVLTDRLSFSESFTTLQTELNLFTHFGSPAGPVDVFVDFSLADVYTLFVGAFANGSIINITGASSTRFLGRGGRGGDGGTSFFEGLLGGCLGFNAQPGTAGDASIILPGTGVTVNLDVDNSYVWGGGGGGGGGGIKASGGDCVNGGGGGGAQGWDTNGGGFGIPASGGTGDITGPGTGGVQADPDGGDGGDGGSWGTAGDAGVAGFSGGQGAGGLGGRAVQVPGSDTLNLSGLKNQVTLEAEGRLLGRNGDPIGT